MIGSVRLSFEGSLMRGAVFVTGTAGAGHANAQRWDSTELWTADQKRRQWSDMECCKESLAFFLLRLTFGRHTAAWNATAFDAEVVSKLGEFWKMTSDDVMDWHWQHLLHEPRCVAA